MGSRPGRKAVLPPDTDAPPMEPPKTAGDVRDAIAQVMADVRSGRLDTKIASTLGYSASVLLKSIEVSDVEERLAALESILAGERKSNHRGAEIGFSEKHIEGRSRP